MKCESATKQPKYLIEPLSDNECRITLHTNETPVEREDGTHYEYNLYTTIVRNRPYLEKNISDNYVSWINKLSENDRIKKAENIREMRDRLLAESDAEMALDRMNLDIPEKITAANLLPTVKAVFDAIKASTSGKWAEYRQKLRDVPQQPGFPYDVVFPEKPNQQQKSV